MRVEITGRCSSKYTMLLRVYCGMSAFTTLLAAAALELSGMTGYAFVSAGICAAMCCAAVCVPMSIGRISYIRSGGSLRIETGLLIRKILIINRSEIRCSEIRRGPIQRRLGLCSVVFRTGGGSVRLRGVNVRDGELLDRAIGGEAAV